MHLRLLSILPLLSCAVMLNPARRGPANKDVSEDCRSCLECSRDNGCLSCPGKLFLFLRREGMWHHGSCLHSCPAGYYGVRGQDMNRCMKCKAANCERCFSKDFCTKCKRSFQLFKGKCLRSCPDGTFPHLTDCIEGCHPGPWGEWTSCEHKGLTCGFRWGRQSRTRASSSHCPAISEDRKCRMKKRCPAQRRVNERKGKGKRRRKEQKLHKNATLAELPGAT
ncbi:R-spondin-4 [Scleropages formosus]|uniref:R-spondin-4 n=1 Tax=Scleropages formosus TaxID=113540 RepID=UPI000878647F|nr:R-spondin-4-like [Scleropages formosus]